MTGPTRAAGEGLTFEGGRQTLVGFALGLAAIVAVFVPLGEVASTQGHSVWYLQEIVLFLAIGCLTLLLARIDRVRLSALGLSIAHLLSAVTLFGAIYLGLTLLGIALAAVYGVPLGIDLLTKTVPSNYSGMPAPWVMFVSFQLLVGLVEEFAIRGYLQNKLVASFGGGSRPRIAAAILSASLLFGALHVPGAVLGGASLGGVIGVVFLPTLTGLLFGAIYELTRNIYFVALLHTLGNTWPLVVDLGSLPGNSLLVFVAGVAVLYLGATLAYRAWATDSALTPTVTRREAGEGLSVA